MAGICMGYGTRVIVKACGPLGYHQILNINIECRRLPSFLSNNSKQLSNTMQNSKLYNSSRMRTQILNINIFSVIDR